MLKQTTLRPIWKVAIIASVIVLWTMTAKVAPVDSSKFAPWNPDKLVKEKTCQLCHGKDNTGNQVEAMKDGPHARAFETLGTAKAKEVAAKMGIDDPQTSGACLQCHATSYGFTQEPVTKEITAKEAISCQTCHGPGNDYKTKHRNNIELGYELGMIKPTAENTCYRCHNETNPTYDPTRYKLPNGETVDFDFAQAAEKIKHPKK